jgi:glycosyltransferase involved in cell wall biosynthesis
MAIPAWVAYHGSADPDALRERWFPATTALVSLSRHSEGRPQVMLEAMAAGLPIVASLLPAHTSTVHDGLTGFLVNDCAEYERAIRRLSSAEVRGEMGAAAREVAKREFGTWQNCIARYNRLYAAL